MRERLVAAFVGLAIVIVALYGIPRAYFLADLIRTQEMEQVDRMATVVAIAVDERRAAGSAVDPVFLSRLTSSNDAIQIWDAGGKLETSLDTPPDRDDNLVATRDLSGGGQVTLTRSGEAVGNDIAQALLPLVLIGLALVIAAGAVGAVLARRLSRPFQELAVAARGLGSGQLQPDLPAYRVPEAHAIRDALQTSGSRLSALLEHERDVASRASHELRTPVTALRLELEDLAHWPETPESVAAELTRSTEELDRLSAAITSLLDRAQEQSEKAAIDLDLNALVATTVADLAAQGREVEHVPAGLMPTRLDPQAVAEVIELLVSTSPTHARIWTESTGSHYEVRVVTQLPSSTVWNRAVERSAAAGGQLTRHDEETALLRLPRRTLKGTREPSPTEKGKP